MEMLCILVQVWNTVYLLLIWRILALLWNIDFNWMLRWLVFGIEVEAEALRKWEVQIGFFLNKNQSFSLVRWLVERSRALSLPPAPLTVSCNPTKVLSGTKSLNIVDLIVWSNQKAIVNKFEFFSGARAAVCGKRASHNTHGKELWIHRQQGD